MAVAFRDVEAAAAAIAGAVQRTPCAHSRTLSEMAGAEIFVKFENLQYTASFKERGALNRLLSLSPKKANAGVIAMSAGNHAQGVAYHARRLGLPAIVVMPRHTPMTKVRLTRKLGARVVLEGADLSGADAAANRLAKDEGLTFVHPYDDDHVIAGQGTIAMEMLEDFPDLDCLVVPVGGGGLISGIAIAAKALKPAIEIVGAEAALFPAMQDALDGRPARPGGRTIAEGIAVQTVGKRTLAITREHVDEMLSVAEREIEHAITLYLEIEKTVAEGAGAVPLAAVFKNRDRFAGRNVGVVLSGGNIDSRLLASVIMRGLVRDGRIVRLRIELSDVPGALAAVANVLGEAEANIIEVHHQRTFSDVSAKGTDIDVVAEMRDSDHVEEVLKRLAAAGYDVRLLSAGNGKPGAIA